MSGLSVKWVVSIGMVVLALAGSVSQAEQGMSPERVVSALDQSTQYEPAVAYNSDRDEYLVVWHNAWNPVAPGEPFRDIAGQFLDRWGLPLGDEFLISPDGDELDRAQPAVAYDPVHWRYLVVYGKDVNGDGSNYDVYGRFLDSNGVNPAYGEFVIGSRSEYEWNARLAFSPSQESFLVVWWLQATRSEVHGALVDAAAMSAAPSAVVADHEFEYRWYPDVAWNPVRDEFLLVCDYEQRVYAKAISSDMSLLGTEYTVADETRAVYYSAVATCGEDGFLVGWQLGFSSDLEDTDTVVRFVNADGSSDADPLHHPLTVLDGGLNEEEPALACAADGSGYLAAARRQYTDEFGPSGLHGVVVGLDKSLGADLVIRSVEAGESGVVYTPAVTGSRGGWLTIWEHQRQGSAIWDVHGRAVYELFMDGFEDGLALWSAVNP